MPGSEQQAIIEKAHADRLRVRDWLLPQMHTGQTRAFTKVEYFLLAQQELGAISRASFDFGWIWAIEDGGRQDWYEPLPRSRQTRQ